MIGGWAEGSGNRTGRIGALLVGYHDGDELRYAGNVGSGFTDKMLKELHARLAPLARDECPFVEPAAAGPTSTSSSPSSSARSSSPSGPRSARCATPSSRA